MFSTLNEHHNSTVKYSTVVNRLTVL